MTINIPNKIIRVGMTALLTYNKFSPVRAITMYRFIPTGGVIYPIPRLTIKIKAKWVISI
jgi:hypothetical protein